MIIFYKSILNLKKNKEVTVDNTNAIIFDIERFAVHDGPGIRTVVFFKGCNLDCIWCCNPESISSGIEFGYKAEKCLRCFRCINSCELKNITFINDRIKIVDSSKCVNCEECVKSCLNNAIYKYGKYYNVQELLDFIARDIMFYKNSGGGVTLSGGEPLLQVNFVSELLQGCKGMGINTAIETAGNVEYENFKKINKYVDLYLFDLKILNPLNSKSIMNINLEQITKNILSLDKDGKKIILRRVLIKGFNDSIPEIKSFFNFAKSLKNLVSIHLLPFHELGRIKYSWLDKNYNNKFRTYSSKELKNKINEIKKINKGLNLKVIIGGLE